MNTPLGEPVFAINEYKMKTILLFTCAAVGILRIDGIQSPLDSPKQTVAEVQYPERVFTNGEGRLCVDFGKDAFGWLEIDAPTAGLNYFLAMGEQLKHDGTLNRMPSGTVRPPFTFWFTFWFFMVTKENRCY